MDRRSTTLVCTAPHPRGLQGDARYQGKVHGVRLQVVPFSAKPTYRKVGSWSEARPGHLIVRCSSCGSFSEYMISSAPALAAEGRRAPTQKEMNQEYPVRSDRAADWKSKIPG